MALVVLLRGVNVGGHRSFRPTELARGLERFGAVNIGAAGTFVVRGRVGRRQLRDEIARLLPFAAEVAICDGGELLRLTRLDAFAGRPERPDVLRFASLLARAPKTIPGLPLELPGRGPWLVRVLARDGRFLLGEHRRRMAAIGALGELDRLYGAPATTRSWGTVEAIGRVLARGAA